MKLTPEFLEDLKKKAEEATPGPWFNGMWINGEKCQKHSYSRCHVSVDSNQYLELIGAKGSHPILREKNAEFIAFANPETVRLLVEAVMEMKKAVVKAIDSHDVLLEVGSDFVECRGDEDCDHCLSVCIIEESKNVLQKYFGPDAGKDET